MHPHLNVSLAGERVRDFTEQAALARRVGSRRRARRALVAALIPAALAAVGLPAAAQAATVEVDAANTIQFRAASGERNSITVASNGGGVDIVDIAGVSSRTPLCSQVASFRVRCAVGLQRIDARLGDQDDLIAIGSSGPVLIDGGPGNDIYTGPSTSAASNVDYRGGDGFDLADYETADRGVRLSNESSTNDGRPGLDRDNIRGDVERLTGSRFGDELTAAGRAEICCAQVLRGGQGGDVMRAGAAGTANTVFAMGPVADGADRIIGTSGSSTVTYSERTRPVNVTLNFGGADDGEGGEGDEITGSNEGVNGGQAGDTIRAPAGSTAEHGLAGRAGNDTIEGADGADFLSGGDGEDTLIANGGDDSVLAKDGFRDIVGCGIGTDTAELDSGDGFSSCENRVGVLRLTPKALRATGGETARLKLSWRHPRSWRQLRRIELRLYHGSARVGAIRVRPRGERITAHGDVTLAGKSSRLARKGTTVSARLAMRLDRSLAGRRLRVEVEAVDVRGARQIEHNAGSIRVAA